MVDLVDRTGRKFFRLAALATLISIIAHLGSCSSYDGPEWTARDMQEWQDQWTAWEARWAPEPAPWQRLLFYRGSDATHHYFHVRPVDWWMLITIPADQLAIADEQPRLAQVSSGPFPGYYALDPLDDWSRADR